jgi:hypothetical protein
MPCLIFRGPEDLQAWLKANASHSTPFLSLENLPPGA